MDETLASLLLQFVMQIENVTRRLRDEKVTVDQWQAEFLRLLTQYLTLAMMRGLKSEILTAEQEKVVADALREQSRYLARFAETIQETGWLDSYLERAKLYASSLTPVFWVADTWELHLPVHPGQRSECGQFCQCKWVIRWLNKENRDVDCYWTLGNSEHCPTCLERNDQWYPLRVRNGVFENI